MPAPDLPFLPPGVPGRDLDDDEFDELDDLLAAAPKPLQPMGIVMLDGFLCGVLVQPVLLAPDVWLSYVFDIEGRPLPVESTGPWHERAVALVLRRYQALNRALLEDGAFDPVIEDFDADPADEGDAAAVDTDASPPAMLALPPASRPLALWAAGFHFATGIFTALDDLADDDEIDFALARIYRHLPDEEDEAGDTAQDLRARLDAELPLANVEDAVDDLVSAVAELADLTRELRYQVDTVRRDAPKVGRNDPCPCGSGKKYKRCHGADAA